MAAIPVNNGLFTVALSDIPGALDSRLPQSELMLRLIESTPSNAIRKSPSGDITCPNTLKPHLTCNGILEQVTTSPIATDASVNRGTRQIPSSRFQMYPTALLLPMNTFSPMKPLLRPDTLNILSHTSST